jgi:hypothetical protein
MAAKAPSVPKPTFQCPADPNGQPCADGIHCEHRCPHCNIPAGFFHEASGGQTCPFWAVWTGSWAACDECALTPPRYSPKRSRLELLKLMHKEGCDRTLTRAEHLWCGQCGALPGVECGEECSYRGYSRLYGCDPDGSTPSLRLADIRHCVSCGEHVCKPTCPRDFRGEMFKPDDAGEGCALWQEPEENVYPPLRGVDAARHARRVAHAHPDILELGDLAAEAVALGPRIVAGDEAAIARAAELADAAWTAAFDGDGGDGDGDGDGDGGDGDGAAGE